MQINKTSAANIVKSTAENTSHNVRSSGIFQSQTAKNPAMAARSVLLLINSAGLPVDKLSASVLTFSRFFSLPLKPELMAAIRRQSLTVSSDTLAQDETLKQTTAGNKTQSLLAQKYRDALSMAAAAAESKGVELTPKGLEFFAEAVDPDLHDRQKEDHNRERKSKNQNEKESQTAPVKQININASDIEKTALEYLEKNDLINLLNRIPCKNDRHWIVVPMEFSHNSREYHVSLKILFDGKKNSNCSVLMALDIVETGNPESRKSFILESANDKLIRLSVYSQSDFSVKDKKLIKGELSKLFNIPANHISVQFRPDSFLSAGCEDDFLNSINEVV